MTVFLFIVESASEELFENVFEGKEISTIDGGSFSQGIDLTNIDKVVEELSGKFSDEVAPIFVDQRNYCQYFYTEEGKAYFEMIKDLKQKYKFHNATWIKFFSSFSGIDDTNHYVFITKKNYKNVYDFANFLQISPEKNCYFIWNVNFIDSALDARSYYNVYSKIPKSQQIDTLGNPQYRGEEDYESLMWIVEYGVSQVKQMILAGFHMNENYVQAFVEPWSLNPSSYFSKGIIVEYDLFPSPPEECQNPRIQKGYLYNELFNISAPYRLQILQGMCLALCKFGLEFGKIQGIPHGIFNVQYDLLLR